MQYFISNNWLCVAPICTENMFLNKYRRPKNCITLQGVIIQNVTAKKIRCKQIYPDLEKERERATENTMLNAERVNFQNNFKALFDYNRNILCTLRALLFILLHIWAYIIFFLNIPQSSGDCNLPYFHTWLVSLSLGVSSWPPRPS